MGIKGHFRPFEHYLRDPLASPKFPKIVSNLPFGGKVDVFTCEFALH
jgi:hypothetical protein